MLSTFELLAFYLAASPHPQAAYANAESRVVVEKFGLSARIM